MFPPTPFIIDVYRLHLCKKNVNHVKHDYFFDKFIQPRRIIYTKFGINRFSRFVLTYGGPPQSANLYQAEYSSSLSLVS